MASLGDDEEVSFRELKKRKIISGAIGVVLLLTVVVLWVGSSVFIQFIFRAEKASSGSSGPFFLTYFSTSAFSIYLAFHGVVRLGRKALQACRRKRGYTSLAVIDSKSGGSIAMVKDIVKSCIIFCPLWFAANYSFNLSLNYTSVASNTVLSTSSSAFTLILSFVLLKEQFTISKLSAVCLR